MSLIHYGQNSSHFWKKEDINTTKGLAFKLYLTFRRAYSCAAIVKKGYFMCSLLF